MQMSETGQVIYERTYSRTKPDGTKETWPETVERVVDGNLALGDPRHQLPNERELLIEHIREFKILPAGRHLWASGTNHTNLYNCWVSDYTDDPAEHFTFTFLRLMEGGGVGANYSNSRLSHLPLIHGALRVHIVCDPDHADYETMKAAGVLSDTFSDEWGGGAFEVEDSREGWAEALADLFDAFYRDADHADRVFDVSRVRKAGARLKTFGGTASGPLPLAQMLIEVGEILSREAGGHLDGLSAMEIDHAIAKCVVSGGARRSARMSIMHWQDPQIMEFIQAKQGSGSHWTTNISVEVDEEFWARVDDVEPDASSILAQISAGMYHNGEPGFWNSSLSNEGEPNEVVSTNPCGEITLEPWEPCNLGHVNLGAFEPGDWVGLSDAHTLITRFVIRATNAKAPDPKSAEVIARNRRVGVGHLGVATYLAKGGLRYSDAEYTWFADWLSDLYAEVRETATQYAHDLRIPVPVKLTTVAPTGTIAKMPGVSEGAHPIFAKHFIRRVRFSAVDPDQVRQVDEFRRQGYTVEDDLYADQTVVVSFPTKDSLLADVEKRYGPDDAATLVEAADDLSLYGMLSFQRMYQQNWADNAVSYTGNFDPKKYSPDKITEILRVIGPELKGATVFPESSMPQSPYERISAADYALYETTTVADGIDPDCANGGACPVR